MASICKSWLFKRVENIWEPTVFKYWGRWFVEAAAGFRDGWYSLVETKVMQYCVSGTLQSSNPLMMHPQSWCQHQIQSSQPGSGQTWTPAWSRVCAFQCLFVHPVSNKNCGCGQQLSIYLRKLKWPKLQVVTKMVCCKCCICDVLFSSQWQWIS